MFIEQAIFTSARTTLGSGYHLIAKSAGITSEVAAELAIWGPSHGSLRDRREDASSVNFHYLSGGQLCVSKSIAAGEEYSERGGARVYTNFLIVPKPTFAKFANQPFAILRAAWAKGLLDVPAMPPTSLRPFTLAGRTARVDEGLLAQFADQLGSAKIARLIAAAVTPGIKVLTGVEQAETIFGGLLNCLPVECRSEISFTTGLRFSPRRPFKLVPHEGGHDQPRKSARRDGVAFVNLSKSEDLEFSPHGWATYVAKLAEADRLTTLTSELQKSRPGLTIEHLHDLGEELSREFRCTPRVTNIGVIDGPIDGVRGRSRAKKPTLPSVESKSSTEPSPNITRPASSCGMTIRLPKLLDVDVTDDPAAMDLVEQLDDAVSDAIHGAPDARELAQKLWSQLSACLPQATVASLREQYLRYSLNLWETCLDSGMREPEKAAGALDVLSLLFAGE
ncbi:MAG: hypothetical protein IT427_04835 [Pirellulales bacterium]|nr:hypothetical protein [Pirellulales bacterium]